MTVIAAPALVSFPSYAQQVVRYVVVGATLALLNLAFLYCMRNWAHLSNSAAVTAMYVFGVLIHFPSHRWITYRAQDRPVEPQLARYAVMLVWNFLVMQAVVAVAGRYSLSPYVGVMIATGLTVVTNFLAMAHIVFARVRTRAAGVPRQVLHALEQRGFTKRSLISADLAAPDLESRLKVLAERMAPGDVLAIYGGERQPSQREAVHLMLLRAGFEGVWAHPYGRTFCVTAARAAKARNRTVSIVVPVFNERETFPELMRALLAQPLELEKEIILVESNSTDGTREQVAQFAGTPGVKIIWQDRPQGKGYAVRAGFAAATGDIVLIQDADLEYDLNDYDVLLAPLLRDEAAFVLGSRHGGQGKMRRFTDQQMLGNVLNTAHLFFTGLINVLYGQRLKDPFTMFKVFRRDCLAGLEFECNRFDFDHELVIKLVLKGYRPVEIPVNYCSRSFKQGKKIRFFRDPPTWIKADLRFRLRTLQPRFPTPAPAPCPDKSNSPAHPQASAPGACASDIAPST
jgi:putative flippase GtrA